MINLSQYLLESSICLAIFYGFYHLFLRRETFFQLNRFYLLLSPALSLLIPLLNISLQPTTEYLYPLVTQTASWNQRLWQTMELEPTPLLTFTVGDLLLLIYGIGVFVMAQKLFHSLWRVRQLIRKNRRIAVEECTVVETEHDLPAASFFSFVFWKGGGLSEQQRLILEHELVHVRQKHSLDVLLMEFWVILKWFNPLIYLFRRSLRVTHEYIADHYVARQSGSKSTYARLLVRLGQPNGQLSLMNSFSLLTKKRLLMLSQKPSPNWRYAKCILSLPLVAVLLLLFSFNLTDNLPQGVKAPFQQAATALDDFSQKELLTIDDFKEKEVEMYTLVWGMHNIPFRLGSKEDVRYSTFLDAGVTPEMFKKMAWVNPFVVTPDGERVEDFTFNLKIYEGNEKGTSCHFVAATFQNSSCLEKIESAVRTGAYFEMTDIKLNGKESIANIGWQFVESVNMSRRYLGMADFFDNTPILPDSTKVILNGKPIAEFNEVVSIFEEDILSMDVGKNLDDGKLPGYILITTKNQYLGVQPIVLNWGELQLKVPEPVQLLADGKLQVFKKMQRHTVSQVQLKAALQQPPEATFPNGQALSRLDYDLMHIPKSGVPQPQWVSQPDAQHLLKLSAILQAGDVLELRKFFTENIGIYVFLEARNEGDLTVQDEMTQVLQTGQIPEQATELRLTPKAFQEQFNRSIAMFEKGGERKAIERLYSLIYWKKDGKQENVQFLNEGIDYRTAQLHHEHWFEQAKVGDKYIFGLGDEGMLVVTIVKDKDVQLIAQPGDTLSVNIRDSEGNTSKLVTDKLQLKPFTSSDPIYLIDGIEQSKDDFEKINPEKIESINVWKGEEAINRFGEKAKDGAINLITKQTQFNEKADKAPAQRIITGTVVNEQDEPLIGANVLVTDTKMGTITDVKGRFELNLPKEYSKLTISYVGYRSMTIPIKGAGKAMRIVMQKAAAEEEIIFHSQDDSIELRISSKSKSGEDKDILCIIDGEVVPEEAINQLDPGHIESISVYKDEEKMVAQFGEQARGKDGVIKITTKNKPSWVSKMVEGFLEHEYKGKNPIIMLDGKEVDLEYLKTYPFKNSLPPIGMLDGKEAVKKYGQKAKDGAIVLRTKHKK